MGDVKRYAADEQYPGQYSARCDLVAASDFDAALAREAALREKIRQLNIRDTGKSSLITDLESRLERANARNASLIKRNDRLKWQRNGTRLELDTSQSELAALREELATSNKVGTAIGETLGRVTAERDDLHKRLTAAEQELANERDRFMKTVDQLAESLTATEQRNSALIASIVALPEDLKEMSGCENTAGVYACIDYISDWIAELSKPTESGVSE